MSSTEPNTQYKICLSCQKVSEKINTFQLYITYSVFIISTFPFCACIYIYIFLLNIKY